MVWFAEALNAAKTNTKKSIYKKLKEENGLEVMLDILKKSQPEDYRQIQESEKNGDKTGPKSSSVTPIGRLLETEEEKLEAHLL